MINIQVLVVCLTGLAVLAVVHDITKLTLSKIKKKKLTKPKSTRK